MRSIRQHFLGMLRSSALLAAGPPGCKPSFSGARTTPLPSHGSGSALPVCTMHKARFPAVSAGVAHSLPAPPPARRKIARQASTAAGGAQQRRRAKQRISRGAGGPDAASVAQEIGRRAAERVKAAEPLVEDDWQTKADRDRRSPSEPSTSGRGRPPPPSITPVPSQRGAPLRGASSATSTTERSPAQGASTAAAGGDGRARRYLDRIAGLKAVPEDFNRCALQRYANQRH